MGRKPETEPEFYRGLLDFMPEGVVVADEDLRIVSLNEPSESMLNISRKKTVGEQVAKFFPSEITRLCRRVISEQRVVQEDDIALRGTGNSLRVECTGSPVYRSDGNPNGLILQIRDADKMGMLSIMSGNGSFGEDYESLVMGLAHEIKNPLSGIKGAAQLLEGPLSDAQRRRCSSIIAKETERLRNLMDRLLKPSRFAHSPPEPVDVNEMLIDIMFLESNLHENIEFRHKLDITIPPVPGDSDSLKQVFLNLIQNAAEAVGNRGEITVSTKWVADYRIRNSNTVLISVRDDGEGIPRENLKKIFTPFFSGKRDGTGLGLFISSRVVAKHGGAIAAESAEGGGSVFRVHLPAGR